MKAVMHGVYDNAKKVNALGFNELGWGVDAPRVSNGIKDISENKPDLWSEYGEGIEEELDNIGSGWRTSRK